MALTKITKTGISNDAIDSNKIEADSINATKIADNAISEEHLDVTALTEHTELSATAADNDILLIYDTSAGTLKKIQSSNVGITPPTFSSVSPTSLTTGDLTGNYTIIVTGTKFDANATFKLRTSGGTDILMDSVTRNSSTQLTGTVAKNTANLTNANEPFDIIITNGSNLSVVATDQVNVDAQPVYTTASGSLGTGAGGGSLSFSVNATDPESAGNVTFELQSGSLPPGLSLTNTVAEGGTAIISGTATNPTANTTYNFVLRAVDAASNTSSRAFSITINRTFTTESFTSSGTFSVPSGVTSLTEVLVVGAGGSGGAQHAGGGGAGGLIFFPEYPVTPSGTVTVTVGCGGSLDPNTAPALNGQDSAFGSPGDPGLGCGGVLTAKGGGGGGMGSNGPLTTSAQPGGSGGGSRYANEPGGSPGGTATQPTQPGNSGAYGFGNSGGTTTGDQTGFRSGGGGGGAGAAGACGSPGNCGPGLGGPGGIGKAYTIADGTTPVYYAGGGGGASHQSPSAPGAPGRGIGAQGGGGDGGYPNPGTGPGPAGAAGCGVANRGGGGGGAFYQASQCNYGGATSNQAKGGKGVVIVRY